MANHLYSLDHQICMQTWNCQVIYLRNKLKLYHSFTNYKLKMQENFKYVEKEQLAIKFHKIYNVTAGCKPEKQIYRLPYMKSLEQSGQNAST